MHHITCSTLAALTLLASACAELPDYDPSNPGKGPGELVGNGEPVSDGNFSGGDDILPVARAVTPPDGTMPPVCDSACRSYCDSSGLLNPINRGLCGSLWGVGLEHRPVEKVEACRRLYVDMVGRFPSGSEVAENCLANPWSDVVKGLIATDEFVKVNRIRQADTFLYNTEAVSVERIYDMDKLVTKYMKGLVGYELWVQVASAHPVLTRRFADPEDIAEAVFQRFIGRPAYEHERHDLGNLYALWTPGYYDHLPLNMRLPDAAIRFRCVNRDGEPDPASRSQCTSVLFGDTHELILTPDWRVVRDPENDFDVMPSIMLTATEWQKLWLPGRVLQNVPGFYEKAVDDVIKQYLNYDLGYMVPEVRAELIRYLFAFNGDIRALHFAVATSAAYLESSAGVTPVNAYRWTYGVDKQLTAEAWIDSVVHMTGADISRCDHRLTTPDDFLEAGSVSAYRMVRDASAWTINGEGEVYMRYADLARTLGGCPENETSSRFSIVSILTTSAQLSFVDQVCNPSLKGQNGFAPIDWLLRPEVAADTGMTPELGRQLYGDLTYWFLGRAATTAELAQAEQAAGACMAAGGCTAETFVRPACFAVLSSSDMLFN